MRQETAEALLAREPATGTWRRLPGWSAEAMGRLRLICRLAVRDLRRRRVEALLLLVAFTAATTTLALGLALNGVTNQPYLQTRNATAGPDVVLQVNPNGSAPATSKG